MRRTLLFSGFLVISLLVWNCFPKNPFQCYSKTKRLRAIYPAEIQDGPVKKLDTLKELINITTFLYEHTNCAEIYELDVVIHGVALALIKFEFEFEFEFYIESMNSPYNRSKQIVY